ncbi:MAG TPA: FtsQ-type POTRA domain-containing protein [Solirubrobacteraceae bacterium]|nr:FtsQ-type POTRA domain-containing protein [Solirubrobacteraceae bacterium]
MSRRLAFLRGFAAVLALAVLLGGGWLWLRDSGLARVTVVHVTGATTSERSQIASALDNAAREMTTLHVKRDLLDDAVASYPSVAGLRVRTDFPHKMSIEVLEHRPVAALDIDGRRVPVSGGGIVLTGVRADSDLPSIRRTISPTAGRVTDHRTRDALAVAAAAPELLLRRSDRLWWGPRGLTLDLRNGPPLIFGTSEDVVAKWAAAARVLAEPSAAGATYMDLRIAGRVAAGGLAPVPQDTSDPDAQP